VVVVGSYLWRRIALVGVCAGALALDAAPAIAGEAHPVSASASVNIQFSFAETSPGPVRVLFTGGITNVNQQTALGLAGTTLQQVNTSSSGWTVQPAAGPATLVATVLVSADGTAGTPVTGTATLPGGATMTATVNNGAKQTITNGSFSLPVPAGVGIGGSQRPSISVSPVSVKPGERVTVSGNVAGGCPAGDAVTLLSKAFVTTYRFAGVPAIYANVRSNSRFAVTTRIPRTRNSGRYPINARCDGGNLAATTVVRVTRP
jgi:hypothetical protein